MGADARLREVIASWSPPLPAVRDRKKVQVTATRRQEIRAWQQSYMTVRQAVQWLTFCSTVAEVQKEPIKGCLVSQRWGGERGAWWCHLPLPFRMIASKEQQPRNRHVLGCAVLYW